MDLTSWSQETLEGLLFLSSDGRERAFKTAVGKQTHSYVNRSRWSRRKRLPSQGFTSVCYTTRWCRVFLWSSCLSLHPQEWKKIYSWSGTRDETFPQKFPSVHEPSRCPCGACYFRSQACRPKLPLDLWPLQCHNSNSHLAYSNQSDQHNWRIGSRVPGMRTGGASQMDKRSLFQQMPHKCLQIYSMWRPGYNSTTNTALCFQVRWSGVLNRIQRSTGSP